MRHPTLSVSREVVRRRQRPEAIGHVPPYSGDMRDEARRRSPGGSSPAMAMAEGGLGRVSIPAVMSHTGPASTRTSPRTSTTTSGQVGSWSIC